MNHKARIEDQQEINMWSWRLSIMRWLRWRRPKPAVSRRCDPAECDHTNARRFTGPGFPGGLIVCEDCVTPLAKVVPNEPWLY